jgi:hypothetical protein
MAELGNSHSIKELIGAGADAMSNMFEVHITIPEGQQESNFMKLRINGFSPTIFSHSTYELHYKSLSILKPTSKIEGPRTFDITFRLDDYYAIYDTLNKWLKNSLNIKSGYSSTNIIETGNVKVIAYADRIKNRGDRPPFYDTINGVSNNDFTTNSNSKLAIWEYGGVWISKITEPEFTYASSDPQEITVTFNFTTASYPWS